jgi:hypothetical protein
MPKRETEDFFLMFASIFSVFGLVILFLILLQPGGVQYGFSLARSSIGLIYAGICVLGIAAVFYPKKCEKTFMFKKRSESWGDEDRATPNEEIRLEGHHPDCPRFSANRITIRKATFCAACTGLLIGAVAALVGTVFYFSVGFIPFFADLRLLLVGYAGMFLGLVQFKFGGYVKLTANALFVIGSFLTLVTADSLGRSLLIGLYVLGLIVFLLLTRIVISEWNNKRVCYRCEGCGRRV